MSNHTSQTPQSLLAVFAHPDDESIMMGGTLALYAQRGFQINLLCATRGEWGSVSDASLLADNADLASIRENELRRACEILGVNLVGFLDCPDSGINESNWIEIEEKIVRQIRILRPQVIVTFGPDGLYWHLDHIAICHITSRAFASSADSKCFEHQLEENLKAYAPEKLYYAAYPDFLMRQMVANAQLKNDTAHLWNLSTDLFGVSADQITTMLNIEETLAEKMLAIRAHQTQFAPGNVFSSVDEEQAKYFLSREYFRLVHPTVVFKDLERDLFARTDEATKFQAI